MTTILEWIRSRRHKEVNAAINSAPELDEFFRLALGGPAASGVAVTPTSGLTHPTVATSLKVISESVAQLPFTVVRELDDGTNEIVKDHPLMKLLGRHGKPNAWQTPFRFREGLTRDAAYRGTGYAIITRARGQIRELIPIAHGRVTPKQDVDFRLTYKILMSDGKPQEFRSEDIFRIVGPSSNGFSGDDTLSQQKDTIGLGLAQEKDTARIFKNGARLGAVLEHPEKLSEEAAKRLKESFNDIYQGVDNAHKTAVLEEDMKFKKAAMTSEEAQALQSRKHQRGLIASIWRIPPHMVGDLEKSTFSNIENLARQFIDYSLMPWIDRWEQDAGCQLLTDAERADGLFIEIDPRQFLRGDSKARADMWTKGIASRWFNPNEIRKELNLPPYPEGNEFFNPAIDTADDGDSTDGEENETQPTN